jgi:putative transcriptional regulator
LAAFRENITEMKNRIRIERAIMDITQADLAEKIGVSRQTINAMESNKYVPSTVLALKIARLFGKQVEEIFELEAED